MTPSPARPPRPSRPRRLARCVLALALLLAAAACGSGPRHGRLTVMVPWSGAEFQAFYSVVKTFEHDTGIHVDVEVTRDQSQQLDAAVAADAPPDLAVLPSVGALDRYAKDGSLRPLSDLTKDYTQPFRGLATVRGTVYAVPVKADVKSLVWYDPSVTGPPPTALSDQLARADKAPKSWCLGLESGPTSGWPGADWIADILLALGAQGAHGTSVDYQNWLSGRLAWTSPEIEAAWTDWHHLVSGSAKGASFVEFGKAAAGMTAKPPTCSLAHGALSAMGFPASAVPGKAYDFVTSTPPSARLLQVSADFVGMFSANPNAAALLRYLSTAGVQRAWVNTPGGYAFSADRQVAPASYHNPVQRRIAAMLQPDSGYQLCFSAADAMQPEVSAAFYRAVLLYAGGGLLTTQLSGLEGIQRTHDTPLVSSADLCAAPS
ncbi:extracellular solute-binding protein [Streptomyces sp. NPDC051976]|uniref:extracellular solute-binding protein n=1 Tax=Streptomyces sp. NPDC051976 TaxID=3154947 RepID=UPI00341743B2